MSRKKNPPTKSAKNAKPASGIGASRQTPAASEGLPQLELNDVVAKIQEMTQLVAAFRAPDSSLNNSTSLSQPGASREWVDSAQSTLLALMRTLLHQMTYIFVNGDAVVAKVALDGICSSIVKCLNAIESSTQDTSRRALFEDEVKNRFEFPCLLSCFNQTSKARYNLIMKKIKLAANVPFRIAPNLKYSPQTMLALYIVGWISRHRSEPSSVYRQFAQELGEKEFCAVNSSVWESVIGFHMDYLMAPEESERATKFRRENAQLLGNFDRQLELMNWAEYFQFKGPITEIPHFKSILEGRRYKKVTSEISLYGKARTIVLQAARNLMKDKIAPSPV